MAHSVGFVGAVGRTCGVKLFGRRFAVEYGCRDDVGVLRHGFRCDCGVVRSIRAVGRVGRLCWLRHGDVASGSNSRMDGRELLMGRRLFWSCVCRADC